MARPSLVSRFATFIGRMGLLITLLATLFVALDFARFCDAATLAHTQMTQQQADGIVVFTGKSNARVRQGVALLEAGNAPMLLISGVYDGATKADIRRITNGNAQQFDCCVTLGHRAKNTQGNGLEMGQWARTHHMKRIILVTEAFHMRRAMIEARYSLKNVVLIAQPVADVPYAGSDWLNNRAILRGLMNEYAKGWGALLRQYMHLDVATRAHP